MASGRVRLSAIERDSITPPNLARSLSAMVWQLDQPAPRVLCEIQGRLALIASRVDRAALEHERENPSVPVPLDGLRLDPSLLRRQLLWLMAQDGHGEADGLACLVEALLARAELGR